MKKPETRVICECCESRVTLVVQRCPQCGYREWPENVQQAIEEQSRELRSWLESAVGDLGGHDMETIKWTLSGRPEVKEKVEQAIKDGVVDVPGWLADYYFNDIDTLHDLTGDRIHDEATQIMSRMSTGNVKTEVASHSTPEIARLRLQIAVAKDMAEGAHSALRIALDDHIGEWQNQLKIRWKKAAEHILTEDEAAAYGDSQIPPWSEKKMEVCSQCASPTNRPIKLHGQVLCQACSSKL